MADTEDLLGLNRPEYAGYGEVLLSSLAWSLTEHGRPRLRGEGGADPGLVYEYAQPYHAPSRKIPIHDVRPLARGRVARISDAEGICFPHDGGIEEAFLDAFRGVIPEKGNSYPAVPLVKSAPFLQDSRGVKAKDGPANFAKIIERIYALGAPSRVGPSDAARRWYSVLALAEHHRLFRTLDRLAQELTEQYPRVLGQDAANAPSDTQRGDPAVSWLAGRSTPFRWFHGAWNTFCRREWREALPRRRWCDWASCILRTGIGMAYLWEARFHSRVAEYLAGDDSKPDTEWILGDDDDLLRWTMASEAISSRDVGGKLRKLLAEGHEIRNHLTRCLASARKLRPNLDPAKDELSSILVALRRVVEKESPNVFEDLLAQGIRSGAPNTQETVKYSLQCRAETGAEADFYSLLARRSRRFLVVEPGPEWIVVMAGVAAGAPGRPTTLGSVERQLRLLGLMPSRESLVHELERAGLAGSSHDADEALVVAPSFSWSAG